MNGFVALPIGVGLGLVCFGGLWLTLRQAMHVSRRSSWMAISQLSRLAVCALVFGAEPRRNRRHSVRLGRVLDCTLAAGSMPGSFG